VFSKHNAFADICLEEGIVTDVVIDGKEWVVRINGIYWHARSRNRSNFSPGDPIKVTGRKGLKLFIASM